MPDQDVAKQLNLSHHRHLWPAYNYTVDADKSYFRKYRATYFSEFHFLLDYIPKHALTSSPLPFPYFSLLNDNEAKKVLDLIDENRTPVGNFLEMLTLPNPTLLNKFSHCPHWVYLPKISELVIARATNMHGQVNLAKLNEFVAALPSAKKNPVEFSLMIREYDNLACAYENIRKSTALPFKAHFFYHNRLRFNEVSEHKVDLNAINDYIAELAKNLVFPEYIRQILNLGDFKDTLSFDLLDIAQNITRTCILENTNQKTLASLTERWHRNLAVIENLKPPETLVCKKWHALFSETCIHNVTFTCLTTDIQLKEEGIALKHCVGGYGGRCKRGQSHIVRAISKSGERATLELTVENGVFTLTQCLGMENTTPGFKLNYASRELVNAINKKHITVNTLRGRIELPTDQPDNVTTLKYAYEIYPYDFQNETHQDTIYLAFHQNKILPPGLRASSYEAMLATTKIRDIIAESLAYEGKLFRGLY